MAQPSASTGLRAGVVVTLVLGVGFIIANDPAITTVGVVLTIVGLMGLMPVVRYSIQGSAA